MTIQEIQATPPDIRPAIAEALQPPHKMIRARVLHLIGKLNVGGATRCTLYQAATTHLMGYPALVSCGFEADREGSFFSLGIDLRVQMVVLPGLSNQPRPLADRRCVDSLVRLVEMTDCRIVHTHGWKGHMLGAATKRRLPHVKLLHQVHGWSWPLGARDLRSRILMATTRRAAQVTDLFGVVTTQDIEKGLALGIGSREQYVVMRSGIDPSEFPPATPENCLRARQAMGLPEEGVIIGSVGGLRLQKNPLAFVRMAALLRSQVDNLRAVWIGDGPLRGKTEKEIQRLGVGDVVVLLGSRNDVPALLAGFDVLVLTSRYEGLARATLEALAVGIPVVGTRNDGAIELAGLVGDEAAFRLVDTPEQLPDAIIQMLNSGRSVHSYTPITVHDTIAQTVAAYERLLGYDTRPATQ